MSLKENFNILSKWILPNQSFHMIEKIQTDSDSDNLKSVKRDWTIKDLGQDRLDWN